MNVTRSVVVALALAVAGWPRAHAMDLMQAWQGALQHAPDAAVADAARQAGAARAQQAKALWRPSVALEGGVAVANSETSIRGAQFSAPGFGQTGGVAFDTSVKGGAAGRYALAVRQPVYSRERDARGRALEIASDAAQVEWSQARQDLMLRTTEAYFAAALAGQRLQLLGRQRAAVERAAREARDRFRLGDQPVTDVHEADAREAALQAEQLDAQTQLEQARATLTDLTGLVADSPLRLPDAPRIDDLATLPAWLARADQQSYVLKLSAAQLQAAQAQASATHAALSPTVDVVAQVGGEHLSGEGDFGQASNTSRNGAIGVQLSVPLYTGGMQSAQDAEQAALVEKARAELERARQRIAQQTRAAWLDLAVGQSQLKALDAALQATRLRLDATRVGRQAGDRTTQDLLNAENDASAAELTVVAARVRLLTHRLRLASLVGELDEAALQSVNAQLLAPDR